VSINFGRFTAGVTEKFLYETEIGAFFQQMGGKTVGEGMHCCVLCYAGFFAGSIEDELDTFDRISAPIIDTLPGIYEAQTVPAAIDGDKEFRPGFCCSHARRPCGYR